MQAVYGELRQMADMMMRRERPDHTLQPSAACERGVSPFAGRRRPSAVQDRRYLFAAAAQAMRQVLVDHARRRGAIKRDGGGQRVPLDQVLQFFEDRRLDVVALHAALDRLMTMDERQGLVVSLRFFVGLSVAEVAEVLDVSIGTVEGDWRIARAWLRTQLGGEVSAVTSSNWCPLI